MHRITGIIFFVFITTILYSQEETKYFNKDQLGLELLSAHWPDVPSDVYLNPRSLAFNTQLMYNIAGRNSNVALAAGLGILSEHYYIDAFPVKDQDKLVLVSIPDSLDYITNKLRFSSVEIPVEIRIRTNRNSRNKSWKFYIGAKAGYLLSSMHKYSGDDPGNLKGKLKQKTYNIPDVMPYHYGLTFRAGYDQVLISAYYSLSDRFEENESLTMQPFMVGLTLFVY